MKLNGVNLSRQTPLIFIKSDSQISDLAPCIVSRVEENVEMYGCLSIHIMRLLCGQGVMSVLIGQCIAHNHEGFYEIGFPTSR